MKRYLILTVLSFMAINALPPGAHALFKTAKVTLVVVDEDGIPIEGVNAGVGFEKNKDWSTEVTPQDKYTDGEGEATFSGQCNGHIAYGAEKEDYYPSYYDYDFKDIGAFGWKPWNPELKIVMRKIKNPLPMYAKKIDGEIPVIEERVGFDLIKGDWVVPYGQGVNSDLIFFLEKDVKSKNDMKSSLEIKFVNKYDGFILVKENRQYGSEFKLLRNAPNDGYVNSLILTVLREPGKWFEESFKEDDNYIIRVRSEIDGEGNFKKGMYGKIIGPIKFAPLRSKTAAIEFKYYLNPDFTRNLEFDPKRNLFGNLPDLERVTEP